MVIVDLAYAGSVKKWLGQVATLCDLPEDPRICVQIRVKNASNDRAVELAAEARKRFLSKTVQLFWNGQYEIARALGYAGCHHPEANIPQIRQTSFALTQSASVHSLDALERAQARGVDFLVFGPVRRPIWKSVSPQGFPALSEVAANAKVPVLAIGGIRQADIESAFEAGAFGIAGISTFWATSNPIAVVESYLEALTGSS